MTHFDSSFPELTTEEAITLIPMLDDGLDSLFGSDVFVPFTDTANFEGHFYLCEALKRRDIPQNVLDPIPPIPWASDESSEEEEGPMMLDNFEFLDGVSSAFGPGGPHRFDYKVNDKEPATNPPVTKMILIAPNGDPITVVPRCSPRKRVTRGCVELAVSQWMDALRNLPPGTPRPTIQTQQVEFNVDGETLRAPVWLWRGLEQMVGVPDTWRLFV